MSVLAVLSALSLVGAAQAEYTVVRRTSLAPRSQEAAVLPPAEFSIPFTGKVSQRKSKKSALAALRGKSSSTVVVDGSDFDEEYLTNVTVGGQHFSLIVDTGSSDTWVPQVGFDCFDLDGNPLAEADCFFGTPGFNIAASKTFKLFPNVSFNITYGDGEFLSGPVGFDTVAVGGVSVTGQEIGVPNLAAWEGDGVNTGLIGLAFPDLTSVYNTTDPTRASAANQLPYDPFFFSAVKQKKVANPFFSVALDRGTFEQQENDPFDPNLGFLALGGIAPVAVVDTAVTVPIEGYSATTGIPENGPGSDFFFYTVDVESFTFPGSSKLVTKLNNTILDTGTTLNYVPTDIALAYNAQFKPKAINDPDFGAFVVACNATVPAFEVTIGGKTFSIDGRDQILPAGTDNEGNLICITGTADGGPALADNIFILGDVFLHNVVATFNPIAGEITLTQRATY
ncbi:aspartic peptidase domain-containing protein [Mycena maculata]|uniref:Aspartic peptidase domain-containing protein n=1 Tax=Mycena maculata TaxID=230809 RepID=A0AAD7IJ79_9AGAR|nr:aspartic peptidase domain-containing protein [Mycena maculata]